MIFEVHNKSLNFSFVLNFHEKIGFSSILSHNILKGLEYTSYSMQGEINKDMKTKYNCCTH